MFHRYSVLFGLSVTLSLAPIFQVNAQLIPDNTLGKENSIVTPSQLLQRIDGGAIRGSNLFHSFKEFNIDNGKSVYFSNPTAIQNILTRVTGKNPSQIFGKLGVLGNANLFLLNPNGIIFGENSSLDISGSFSATTSPSVLFDDGFEFSAINPNNVPLLKVNITPGLQYPSSQQGDITNKGNLTVGEDLNLIGKNIDLTGSLNSGRDLNLKASGTLQIRDDSNNPFIADAGYIKIIAKDSIAINNSQLKANSDGFGDAGFIEISSNKLNISDNSQITISSKGSEDGGYILITASDINLNNYSKISATTENGSNAYIDLKDLKSLQLTNHSEISASTVDGTAGYITINASDEVKILSHSKLESAATGKGEAGFLDIKTNNFSLSDNSQLNATSEVGQNLGYVSIEAQKLSIDNQAMISASTVDGIAGSITINASDEVKIASHSKLESAATGKGEAGFLDIKTNNFSLSDNSQLNATSEVGKNLGYVSIEAQKLSLDNQAMISASTVDGIAGFIEINASNEIKVESNSRLESAATGKGEAGFLDIKTNNFILSDNSQLNATSKVGQNLGYVSIEAQKLSLDNQAMISASTVDGIAGFIEINASDEIKVESNSRLESAATGKGEAGFLDIKTNNFSLSDNSQVTVSSKGSGNAGYILIEANNVNLNNQAEISATTYNGEAGGITLKDLNTLFLNNSEISASTIDGQAGNLDINTTDSIELIGKGGLSVKSTQGGIAGYARISTSNFTISDGAKVSVSSPSGQAGSLDIAADKLSLNQGILIAETGIGEGLSGANITLDIKNLLIMSNNSFISAEAFNAANGGNITINNSNGFIIGLLFENNDISANANQGNGGNIDITTQNIFGLTFREQQTPKSDITASSKFGLDGEVTVNQLNVNPASSLVELPSTLVGTTGIKAGCAASNGNNFIVRGKGGLPQSPDDLFSGETTITELFDLVTTEQTASNIRNDFSDVNVGNKHNQIVEATGWIVDTDGNVTLVAKRPDRNLQNSLTSSVDCENFSAIAE